MAAIQNFNLMSLLDTLISVAVAFALGSAIGLERQVRQRTAGLRTNALVAIGAAIFVDMGNRIGGHSGTTQIAAYVVSGVGFLGAGAIMKEGANVIGLNTAATLWGSAAVGACAGADLIGEALVGAIFVLSANTLLRPVVNRINRQPIDQAASEATYFVYVICRRDQQADIHEKLLDVLAQHDYPVRDVEAHPFGQTDAELRATLYATAVEPEELDKVVLALESEPGVSQTFWNAGSGEE